MDALAQRVAQRNPEEQASASLLKSAKHAAKFHAGLLGVVTWAANHHERSVVDADTGMTKTVVCRDSVDAPKAVRGRKRHRVRREVPKRPPDHDSFGEAQQCRLRERIAAGGIDALEKAWARRRKRIWASEDEMRPPPADNRMGEAAVCALASSLHEAVAAAGPAAEPVCIQSACDDSELPRVELAKSANMLTGERMQRPLRAEVERLGRHAMEDVVKRLLG